MILDYHEPSRTFLLTVDRHGSPQTDGAPSIRDLMADHGLDLSIPLSSSTQAVLFTREPYAAVTFFRHGTPGA